MLNKYSFRVTFMSDVSTTARTANKTQVLSLGATSFDHALLQLKPIIAKMDADFVQTVKLLEEGRTLLIYDWYEGWLYTVNEKMDWRNLYSGRVTTAEVQTYIQDSEWQSLRESLKGKSLEWKYVVLRDYLLEHPDERARQVRVTNYVTALSRGGLIKPEDYR